MLASGNVCMNLRHGASKGSCASGESLQDFCHRGALNVFSNRDLTKSWGLVPATAELGISLSKVAGAVLPVGNKGVLSELLL